MTIFFFLAHFRPFNFHGGHGRKLAIFFGDSITQHGTNPLTVGWFSALSYLWSRRVDCINRGFSGYNSKWGKDIYEEVVLDHRPDLICIFFGANDAVVAGAPTFVSLTDFEHNLDAMVQMTKKRLPATSIVLITPPPIWETALEVTNAAKGKPIALDRTNDRTLQYANVVVAVGAKWHVPVLNAWKGLGGATQSRGEYLLDGLHLNAKGNQQLFELFKDLLARHLPQWLPTAIPMHKASWDQLASN